MATYAIGDVQGCMQELRALLEAIAFDAATDELWFVGDLVNRGPASLEVLRFVRSLGHRARVVLGNHDLHLISLAEGFVSAREDDTLQSVLSAPDRRELIDWLRTQPLLHVERGWVMVHAGLLPGWDLPAATALAAEVTSALKGTDYRDFLAHLYGSRPERWSGSLSGHDRLRVIVNAMTRMRFCAADGTMELRAKGETNNAPPGFMPWFDVPGRLTVHERVVFGHWSALGLYRTERLFGLDSGCVWGGALTALRLEDCALTQIPCGGAARPARSR